MLQNLKEHLFYRTSLVAACVSKMEAVILTSVKSVRNRDKIQALSKKKRR